MAITDQYGNSVSSNRKLINASSRYDRGIPWQPDFARDIDVLFDQLDWRTTLSASRSVVSNNGVIKYAIQQKADSAVGRAWEPEFKGTDEDFATAAKDWLRSWFLTCDVRGNLYDFKTNINLDSVAIDRDGGVMVLLTETKTGYPQVQHIPAHRCGSRGYSKIVESGKYKGLKIKNGVVQNKYGAPVAYLILGDTAADDEYIDSQNIVNIADPEYHDQSRGIPSTSHGINELRKSAQSKEFELMAQMMLSAHALIEYNESGGVDLDDPSVQLTGDVGDDDRLAIQTYSGGMVRHFKSNSGSKIESISHNRPGDMWDTFQDRILRETLGPIWPYELAWKKDGLNGTSIRNVQTSARCMVERRQDVLYHPMVRIIGWAISKAIKIGQLPPSDDWYRWGFTMPPKITIDPRNDSKTQIEEYKLGAVNMTGILQEKGKTHADHIRERCAEIIERKTIQGEYESKYGVEIDDRELQMLTPNDTKTEEAQTTENNDNDE